MGGLSTVVQLLVSELGNFLKNNNIPVRVLSSYEKVYYYYCSLAVLPRLVWSYGETTIIFFPCFRNESKNCDLTL